MHDWQTKLAIGQFLDLPRLHDGEEYHICIRDKQRPRINVNSITTFDQNRRCKNMALQVTLDTPTEAVTLAFAAMKADGTPDTSVTDFTYEGFDPSIVTLFDTGHDGSALPPGQKSFKPATAFTAPAGASGTVNAPNCDPLAVSINWPAPVDTIGGSEVARFEPS